ncbi:MAG: uroporphyrinogen-III synthase [Erythrobacter sp.]|nr:uroporphyrinogen-III synthase [Erythrobacter sp.]
MIRPAFLLRPEPGWSASAAAARTIGLTIEGEPLAEVEPAAWQMPDAQFDGLLVGSANVFRHGGADLEALRDLPVHCVGETTAAIAREHGFTVETVGRGGLAPVIASLAGQRLSLLRLCGEARVDLEAPDGIELTDVIVYRLRHRPIAPAFADKLREGGAVLLHSAELARHFASECTRLGLARDRLEPVLIGPRLLPAIGEDWRAIHVAEHPDDAALLALAAQVCSKAG